ncbi:MAG: T9SS type A sorting domain-containing protein, partial [Ignavibacteria bacterium]|nr:T9SS type A sorting domain-containing protein [Ignavibacteria bacterium]
GTKIKNGDYVQANPNIKLQFYDNSRMVISDTSNIKVYKFNTITQRYDYIPYVLNGVQNPVINIEFPDNNFLQATVNYHPVLTSGEHRFRYIALDNTGNFADSVLNSVVVDNDLKIYDMANYPNPMTTETNFMFKLSGELNPVSCKVKIYTVAGRLIKEINAPANVGYNNIHWDGKDNDGDYLANGTYLYKFIIQGNSQTETSVQKIAILR